PDSQQIANSVFELHLANSKKLLRKYINQYNSQFTGKGSLKYKLRASHIKLAEHLLVLYYGTLRGQQRSRAGVLRGGEPLPTLRTSNGALAAEMGVCKSTIMNLRVRLRRAGLIAYKAWHGTNAPYELDLNPMVMFLRDQSGRWKGNLNGLFFSCSVKTLDHTVSGTQYPEYPDQDTKKERNKSGEAEASMHEDASAKNGEAEASSASDQDTGSGYTANVTDFGQSHQGEDQDTSPPDLRGTPPPERFPVSLEEAIGHLSPQDQLKVKHAATLCWSKAEATIYRDEWLSDGQKEAGRIALAEYLARCVHPKRYAAARGEIQERIDMVFEWLRAKEKRFVLLPRYYFDIRNAAKGGFLHTESWMRAKQVRRYRRSRRTAVTKAVNKYLKTFLPGQAVDRQRLHHELTQTLRKKWGKMAVLAFEQRIKQTIQNL
ncbi:MAG: hypothetical protein AAFY48_15950, partial [Bacteroidota bacterium]